MRSLLSDLCRRAAMGVFAFVAGPASADPTACVEAAGVALVGFFGTARVQPAEPIPLFAPNDVFCAPPHADELALGGAQGTAIAAYLAGTGLGVATGAAGASSNATGLNRADLHLQHILEFRVDPDDPDATGPIPIRVRVRHDFERVVAGVSGPAVAENVHEAFYEVRAGTLVGTGLDSWNTSGLVATDGGIFEFERLVDAPAGIPLYLLAIVHQTSAARGGRNGIPGGGTAEISSVVTSEVDTEAAASIVFAVEERLGLPPPRLGVVVAPETTGAVPALIAFVALHAVRRSSDSQRRLAR